MLKCCLHAAKSGKLTWSNFPNIEVGCSLLPWQLCMHFPFKIKAIRCCNSCLIFLYCEKYGPQILQCSKVLSSCLSTHTHSSVGWGAGCPPVSCHHWIWSTLWQIPSVESGERWACPTGQWEEEEEKEQHGGELVLLLIAVCPIPPAWGKSLFLFLWLNHSLPSTLQVWITLCHPPLLHSLLFV